MELRELLTAGEQKLGGRKPLAEYLGLSPDQLTNIKAYRRPLPDWACIRLAELLEITGEDIVGIFAASALATEKDPKRREIWRPFADRLAEIALILVAGIVTTFCDTDTLASRTTTGSS